MKLRVRAPSGTTHRVEVPELCSVRALRERVAAVAQIPVATVRLSLNKRDEFSGPPGTLLSSIGICGGDLLYLLSGDSETAGYVGGSAVSPSVPESRPLDRAGSSKAASASTPRSNGASGRGSSSGAQALRASPPRLSPSEAARLRREACAAAAAKRLFTGENAVERVEALVVDRGAVSAPFEPLAGGQHMGTSGGCPQGVESASPKASWNAGAAAEGELAASSSDAMETDTPQAEMELAPTAGDMPDALRRILATEADAGQSGTRGSGRLAVAVHAVMLETGLVPAPARGEARDGPAPPPPHALPSAWTSGRALAPLHYTLPGPYPVSCTLRFQTMGGFLVVYGIVQGSLAPAAEGVVRVSLPVEKYCYTGNPASEEKDGSSAFQNLRQLWRDVKDNLSVPLLTVLCRQAGLQAPPSLLVLPTEVKMQILESLSAVAVASCACVCSELRFLAGEEDLWKALYRRDFGSSASSSPPGGRSWKRAYAVKVTERRQLEEQRRTLARLHDMPRHQVFPPRYPFYPAPGIIGGDYDLFPAIGGGGMGGGFGGPGFGPGGFAGVGPGVPTWPGQLADPSGLGGPGTGQFPLHGPFGGRARGELGELPGAELPGTGRPGLRRGPAGGRGRPGPHFPGSGGIM